MKPTIKPIAPDFAAWLRQNRVLRGFTQQQLAEKAGVRIQCVGRVERGKETPSIDTAHRLAVALNRVYELGL